MKHFIKDMKIAQEEMSDRDIELEILNKVLEMYTNLNKDELGTQALIHHYEKEN